MSFLKSLLAKKNAASDLPQIIFSQVIKSYGIYNLENW